MKAQERLAENHRLDMQIDNSKLEVNISRHLAAFNETTTQHANTIINTIREGQESHGSDIRSDSARLERNISHYFETLNTTSTEQVNMMMALQEKMMCLLIQESGDKYRVLELEQRLKDISNASTEEDFEGKIQDCIQRLYSFGKTDGIDFRTEEAQDILEDLLDILKALLKNVTFSRTGNNIRNEDFIDQRRAIKRICGSLSSAPIIKVGNSCK